MFIRGKVPVGSQIISPYSAQFIALNNHLPSNNSLFIIARFNLAAKFKLPSTWDWRYTWRKMLLVRYQPDIIWVWPNTYLLLCWSVIISNYPYIAIWINLCSIKNFWNGFGSTVFCWLLDWSGNSGKAWLHRGRYSFTYPSLTWNWEKFF